MTPAASGQGAVAGGAASLQPQAWDKLDRLQADASTAPRLSLVGHCIDVAAVA